MNDITIPINNKEDLDKLRQLNTKYPLLEDYHFLKQNIPAGIITEEQHQNYFQQLTIHRKEYLEQEKINTPLKLLKHEILISLKIDSTKQATELMVQHILNHENIFTTRDDERSEMWIYKEGIYLPEGRTYIKEICREVLAEVYTSQFVNLTIQKIEAETFIEQQAFFNNENIDIIPVQNGLLNIFTRELKPFDPQLKFFNKLPIIYNPELDCPSIKTHFREVLANFEDSKVMQELFGYLLLRDYRIEKAAMLHGGGRNGKGKTVSLMTKFIGKYNTSNIDLESIEKNQFAIGELFNKMANINGDLSPTALKKTGNFKQLVGNDDMSAPRKFKTNVQFQNYAKMIFCANELPITYDESTAFFERWILIDFPYTFLSEEDVKKLPANPLFKIADIGLINKISSEPELTGLLNWALDGLDRLLKNKRFSESPGTTNIKNRWIRKSDSFVGFLMENVEEDDSGWISKKDLAQSYRKYCKEHKVRLMGDKHISFKMQTQLAAYTEQKSFKENDEFWKEWCWVGIKLKEKTK